MASISCSAGDHLHLLRTALMTSFMRQVAEAYICETCAELREDGETSQSLCSTDERWIAVERNDDRGRRDQSTIVEIFCKGEH